MNPEVVPPPKAPQEPVRDGRIAPSFWLALRGICLLSWRTQFAWKRLPLRLLSLLALPLLVYITCPNSQDWRKLNSLMGDPAMQLNRFYGSMNKAKMPVEPEQRVKLLPVFQEEFARAEGELAGLEREDNTVEQRGVKIREGYDRVEKRAQEILSELQFKRFREFCRRNVELGKQRAQEKNGNWTSPFYHMLMEFYFFIVLPLNCVRQCGGLIRDEVQANTLSFLATRPLSRAGLLVAKYLAQTGYLQLVLLLQTALLFWVGYLRDIPGLTDLLPLFLAVQILAVFAWSALGLFLGQISSRYMALALLYGAVVELGIGRIPTNINTLSIMRHLKTLLAHNPELQSLFAWSGAGVPFSLCALVIASGVFLGLAALLFTFLEYHHTAEMRK
jgi:ABC-type transport system involved in multi-copper enzyme maturation permease subunit